MYEGFGYVGNLRATSEVLRAGCCSPRIWLSTKNTMYESEGTLTLQGQHFWYGIKTYAWFVQCQSIREKYIFNTKYSRSSLLVSLQYWTWLQTAQFFEAVLWLTMMCMTRSQPWVHSCWRSPASCRIFPQHVLRQRAADTPPENLSPHLQRARLLSAWSGCWGKVSAANLKKCGPGLASKLAASKQLGREEARLRRQ